MVRKSIFLLSLFLIFVFISPLPVFADSYLPASSFEKFLLGPWGNLIYLIIFALGNMVFETIILFVLGLRKRRQILSVLVANLISWPIFYFASESTKQFSVIILYELLVVLFETVFIYRLNREVKLSKLFIKIFIANLLSATLGSYLLKGVLVKLILFLMENTNLFYH